MINTNKSGLEIEFWWNTCAPNFLHVLVTYMRGQSSVIMGILSSQWSWIGMKSRSCHQTTGIVMQLINPFIE